MFDGVLVSIEKDEQKQCKAKKHAQRQPNVAKKKTTTKQKLKKEKHEQAKALMQTIMCSY